MTRPILSLPFFFPILSAAVLLACAAPRAGAVLILGDDFNYTDGTAVSGGTLNGNAAGAADSFSTAWTAGANGGTMAASGGALLLTPTSGITAANRSFGTTLGAMETATGSTTLWMGYTADITTVGDRVFGLALLNGGTQVLFAGKGSPGNGTLTDAGAAQNYGGAQFETASTTVTSGGRASISSVSPAANTPYEILTKIDFTNSLITFYAVPLGSLPADPSSLTGGVTLSASSVNFTTLAGANGVTLQAGFLSSGQTTSIGTYDSFRLGTTYSDVVPVPEPSAAALAALGFGLLAWRAARGRFRERLAGI